NPQRIAAVCEPANIRLIGDRRIDVPARMPNRFHSCFQVRDLEEHVDLRTRIVAVQAHANTGTLKPPPPEAWDESANRRPRQRNLAISKCQTPSSPAREKKCRHACVSPVQGRLRRLEV